MSSGNIYDAESQLDFRKLKFYDRDEDIASLNQAYEQSFTISRPQIVWLKGNPGVGKSSLVEHVFLSKEYYCAGKFERLRTSMPYSALTQLLCKLCYTLEFEDKRITTLSASDEEILSELVPEMLAVFASSEQNEDNPRDVVATASCKLEWGLERLKQALHTFLTAVCGILESPLILFLDDMQWADQDTIELLQDLLVGDGETKKQRGNGILFIGAYRDNEVQEGSHPALTQCIQTLSQQSQQEFESRISQLQITNLSEKTTVQLVADLTSSKPEEIVELAKLVYAKTVGNCFYTLHAMRHIHEKELLYRSTVTMRWAWDASTILEEIQVSDNIAEFMARQLRKLPRPTLDALSLAAFLGAKVEIELLRSLCEFIFSDSPPLLKVLQPALDANLIEMASSRRKVFKFTHDRVTDAAYSIIPEGRAREELHLRIGWHLHGLVVSSGNDDDASMGNDTSTTTISDTKHWQLILAVDQLNRGVVLLRDKRELVLVAKLNLIAAQQVLQTGAFKVATGFLESGLRLLGSPRWRMSYDLTLQLSITLASVLYSNGRMEQSLNLLDEIFENTTCPEDRYQAHSIQLDVLESTGQIEKCMRQGMTTLAELGHPKIPRKPHLGHMVVGVVAAQKALRKMTDEDILSLPVCTDPKKEFIMRHLNCLASIAYFTSHEAMMVVMAYRVLQLSLRCGLTRHSAYSFCSHGVALGLMGDLDGAYRFAELAVKLMHRFPIEDYRTSSFADCMIYHLKKPIHKCINSSLQEYHAAFSKGDLRSAGMACLMHVTHRYTAGLPLESIAKDAVGFCHQLKKYQQTLMLKYLLYLLRTVLEHLGRSDEISSFVKNGHDDQEFESYVSRDGDKNGLNDFWLLNMATQFRLGDPDAALQFAEKSWRAKGPSGIFVFNATNLLFSALTAIHAWKNRRNRRHWRMFRKCHKELGTWVEKGNLNTQHLVLLLNAELAVVKKQCPDKVRSMFESSISLASRCGFVHDAALASERAGQYCIHTKDMYWAEHYLTNAHELYADWTAAAKVKQMEATYSRFIIPADDQKSAIISCTGTQTSRRKSNVSLTGRSRLAVVAQVEAKRESFGRVGTSTRIMGVSTRMPKRLPAKGFIAKGA